MKIDLTKVRIEDIEGNEAVVDVAKLIGNTLYMQGKSINECELGRRIFKSEGEVEINDQEADLVRNVARMLPYVTQLGVLKQFNV